MSSRSVARRPRQRLGRRPIPPRSSTRPAGGLTSPRGGIISRYLPAAVIAAGIVAVVLVALGQLGTSKSSARTETEIVTASDGVVQSTVSGTGSLEPVTEEDVDFQTSGTLSHVYVKEGDFVRKGQLLATLGDTTASLTLKGAKATLAEARTTLSNDEKTLADGSSSSDTIASVDQSAFAEDVSYAPTSSTPAQTTPTETVTTQTVTAPTTSTTTATTPTQTTQTTPATTTEPTETTTTTTSRTGSKGSGSEGTGTTGSTGSGSTGSSSTGSSSTGSSSTGSSSTGSSSTVTAATVDADKLQVVEDEQTVREDRQSLDQTRLRAPVSGTITSLESITPGDSVSSGSTSSADSSSSTSTTGSTALASSTGSSSTSSSSSSFAVIDSLKRLSMTVSFTEADINKLKVGQPAVVTLDALSNLELAGKVTNVSSIGTTSDDVTSYDATVTLNQYDSRVKPGMSASAEVVIKQGHGVTVPSGAVTGSGNLATVTEDVNGKHTTKKVIVGIRGDSRDLIVSGLSSGAELVETETLPSLGSSASTSSSSTSSGTGAFGRRTTGFGGGFSGGFAGGGFSGTGGGGPP